MLKEHTVETVLSKYSIWLIAAVKRTILLVLCGVSDQIWHAFVACALFLMTSFGFLYDPAGYCASVHSPVGRQAACLASDNTDSSHSTCFLLQLDSSVS